MTNKSKKILIIRLGAIGDVVNSCVIHQSIKQKYPDYEIHFLTSPIIAPLLEDDPDIKKVWTFNYSQKGAFFALFPLGLRLFLQRFDLVVNLQNSLRNKILSFLAMPKKIISKDKTSKGHSTNAFTKALNSLMPEVEIVKNIKLYTCKKQKEQMSELIQEFPRPLIAISAGGENDNSRQGRIWPLKNWIELGDKLTSRHGGTIIILGSKPESAYQKPLNEIQSSKMFSGTLSLKENATLISLCDLFISGDSGPLHTANAIGTKAIGLYGSTLPKACGPYGTGSICITADKEVYSGCIACSQKACNKLKESIYTPCMEGITVEQVLNTIEDNKILSAKSSH